MEGVKGRVEAVKRALKDNTATQSSVTALQDLLSSEKTSNARSKTALSKAKAATTTRKPAAMRPTGGASRSIKNHESPAVHDDAEPVLSRRDRYTLATEVVNVCLVVLSDLAKTSEVSYSRNAMSPTDRVISPSLPASDKSVLSQRALQPRSANATPVRTMQRKDGGHFKGSPNETSLEPSNITIPAECAHLAISFLRTMDTGRIGVPEMAFMQLDSASLALAGSLITLGLFMMAVRQLRLVKRSLEARFQEPAPAKKNAGRDMANVQHAVNKETLASLMHLEAYFTADEEVLNLATSYYFNVLKVIAALRKPAVAKELVHYLAFEDPNSMIGVILRRSKVSSDHVKSANQLETLSQMILTLCPSVGELNDEQAKDSKHHPSPETAFELQVLALRVRKSWWMLANHAADIPKELLEPFYKCANAFQRRQRLTNDASATYGCIARHFKSIGPFDRGSVDVSLFNIHCLLCTEAERANTFATARKWVDEMLQDCASLDDNDVKRLICIVKRAAILLKHNASSTPQDDINVIRQRIQTKLTGAAADYDPLLDALTGLCEVLKSSQTMIDSVLKIGLSGLTAAFALRYFRSYPERSTHQIRSILDTALRLSTSADGLLVWLTEDAAKFLVQTGVSREVAHAAKKQSLSSAWSSSSSAIALSQILRALLLRAVRNPKTCTTLTFDIQDSEPSERGALLEWQLRSAADLTRKSKYHGNLRVMLPDILERLSKVYTSENFPLRRARVAIAALKIWESQPDLIPPHSYEPWQSICLTEHMSLGKDADLCSFFRDLKAALDLGKALSDGQPSVNDLMPPFRLWEELIDGCKDRQSLHEVIDDPQSLVRQLESACDYITMLGEQHACIPVKRLHVKLVQLLNEANLPFSPALCDLASQYLDLGYSEKAKHVLASARADPHNESSIDILQYHVVYAEYALAVDDLHACRSALDKAREMQAWLPTSKGSEKDRRDQVILLARACMIYSKLLLDTGLPHESLASAKRAVKYLNNLWSGLHQSASTSKANTLPDLSEPALEEPNERTKGVSKLQLKPDESAQSSEAGKHIPRGAAFWTVLPILCHALLHLSDLYVHHGLYMESNYYSERALHLAKSVNAPRLLMSVRSQRSRLLALAGQIDEASLCLAQNDLDFVSDLSLASVERCCARAAVLEKENFLDEAVKQYQRAETMIETLGRDDFVTSLERLMEEDVTLEAQMSALSLDNATASRSKPKKDRSRAPSAPRKVPSKGQPPSNGPTWHSQQAEDKAAKTRPYLLAKTLAHVLVRRAHLHSQKGEDIQSLLSRVDLLSTSTTDRLQQRFAHFQKHMQEAKVAFQRDVTLNVLEDSTLSLPAVTSLVCRETQSIQATDCNVLHGKGQSKNRVDSKDNVGACCIDLLRTAKNALSNDSLSSIKTCSTAQTYVESAKILSASLLLSAISRLQPGETSQSPDHRMLAELPRTKAMAYELRALAIDEAKHDVSEPQLLPAPSGQTKAEALTAEELNADFINSLPKSWTAVSLTLNEDASELYIARYHAEQEPLILRLPFSRHKAEASDEESFDYHQGKAELQEIIELSNYTCHNPGNLESKGVKSKWWKEREALDRRMQELLVNIESIWFGGFKGILATQARCQDLLNTFRKSFEGILDRYLPSRKSAKQPASFSLHDLVLELFVGLGDDQNGVIDLDEPLADLLYFVVDMLQFSGERNAYDEIDFDSMAVDVLDALRPYHSNAMNNAANAQHLILVLDKRLQAFPWESLPCLQEANVSRVGSMLSLRKRLLAQHTLQDQKVANSTLDGHVVNRTSGTYILNPSGDLRGTQDMLQPVLSELSSNKGASWSAIVNEPPDEARFVSALTDSSLLLYFGHGAGSQYIRPRSIKRLDRCCDVVWLMGCSSGMVNEYGELEPTAIPLNYLVAGECNEGGVANAANNCKAVVATLWDVTDKDIDRFSLALGEEWGLWPASEQSKLPKKTPKKRHVVAAPTTPQQAPRTPKTPKVLDSPAPLKTPAKCRTRRIIDPSRRTSLVEAVSRSRDACYLRYLNGAATVVYGVPVFLGD